MLLEQLEECSRAVEKAERYEMQLELYRLILPVYEARRDYEALTGCFNVLAQSCSRATEASRTGKRLLGTFYRVALYGRVRMCWIYSAIAFVFLLLTNFSNQARFGDESGTEYIYKEPKVTNLSEIAQRLNKLYSAKFGADKVKFATDSNPVNASFDNNKRRFDQWAILRTDR